MGPWGQQGLVTELFPERFDYEERIKKLVEGSVIFLKDVFSVNKLLVSVFVWRAEKSF